MRFKERGRLRDSQVPREQHALVSKLQRVARKTSQGDHEGGCAQPQIFSADEAASRWKKMPSRTLPAREQKSVPGFKAAKHRLTLSLGAKAAETLGGSQCSGIIAKISRPLRSRLSLPCLCLPRISATFLTSHLLP